MAGVSGPQTPFLRTCRRKAQDLEPIGECPVESIHHLPYDPHLFQPLLSASVPKCIDLRLAIAISLTSTLPYSMLSPSWFLAPSGRASPHW
jgi:hypothetical protein